MRGAHNSGQWLPRIAVTVAVTVAGCAEPASPGPLVSVDVPALVAQTRLAAVAAAARTGHVGALAGVIAAAPVEDRPRLAHRGLQDLPSRLLDAAAAAGPELAAGVGTLREQREGPAAALGAREAQVRWEPDDADAWDALARARIAAGHVAPALAAWDRAIAIAPAQSAFRTAPIQALVIAQQPVLARQRADALAAEARATMNVEQLVTASAGAAFVDATLALTLAREALARRPHDGRIAFLVAQRLAETNDKAGAARAYADLLVCGAHGKPWHRHEVAAKLQQLGGAHAAQALAIARTCEVPEPADLAPYVEALRSIH